MWRIFLINTTIFMYMFCSFFFSHNKFMRVGYIIVFCRSTIFRVRCMYQVDTVQSDMILCTNLNDTIKRQKISLYFDVDKLICWLYRFLVNKYKFYVKLINTRDQERIQKNILGGVWGCNNNIIYITILLYKHIFNHFFEFREGFEPLKLPLVYVLARD
jgi:hypothetical protein